MDISSDESNDNTSLPGGDLRSLQLMIRNAIDSVDALRHQKYMKKSMLKKRGPQARSLSKTLYHLPEALKLPRLRKSDDELMQQHMQQGYGTYSMARPLAYTINSLMQTMRHNIVE